ncbi:MAG: GHKL domain-containing protein [Gammaproteobacteria bacterium]|nr:MAG: GHKL domain-containing protein [Gammaproteobacteria bacterium]
MGFKNFRLQVILRVFALVSLSFVMFWGLLRTEWQITPLISGLLAAICTFDLIRYVEKTNRELATFLEFIRHHDFSVNITNPGKGRVFSDLGGAYKLITGEYQRLNLEKEAHYLYLEEVIEHVSIALICLDAEGAVALMNRSAKKLFKSPYLPSGKAFARVDKNLPEILQRLADGERHLVSLKIEDETLQLVLYATEFQLLDQRYKLVSFQNIRDELEQREIDSWQKLIRVLTHEIMNSVTPIISLTGVIKDMLMSHDENRLAINELTNEQYEDLMRSIKSIESRSKGLVNFVRAYTNLINVPAPAFTTVYVLNLFDQVQTIMLPELERNRIRFKMSCPVDNLAIRADQQMIEQVLINLIKNAMEALTETAEPNIQLRAFQNRQGKVLLQVVDNGPGIDPVNLENIFVPFFTTKRNGSGIGLSISRQILHVNKGLLSVKTAPGKGCIFTLRFN